MTSKSFFCTTLGLKFLMALSGLIWAGFVMGHMAGNMLVFIGPDAYNKYGHAITSGYFIYVAEAVLISALVIHIICAVVLTKINKNARGEISYQASAKGLKSTSFASQTMIFHGLLILFFIVTHLITFKFGIYHETTVEGVVMRDLHKLMVEVFNQPLYVFFYILCLVILGLHLSHGVESLFQSIGIKNHKNEHILKTISIVYAVVVTVGFLSQPIYIFLMR